MRRTFARIATAVVFTSTALVSTRAAAYEGIAIEADGSIVVASSGSDTVYRIDPVTGATTVVSSDDVGSGPPFNLLRAIAVVADGSLLVTENSSIRRVDPVTGERTLVSGLARGSGPMFLGLVDIDVAADGTLFVADRVAQAVLRVDPSTGDRANVSPGSPLAQVNTVAVETAGTLVVGSGRDLVRVDPATGQRTILSDRQNGEGPSLRNPIGIEVAADGNLVVAEGPSSVGLPISAVFVGFAREPLMARVDATTGDRAVISGGGRCLYFFVPNFEKCLTPFFGRVGRGPVFGSLREVAIESDGSLLGATATTTPGSVIRVDPATGQRTEMSSGPLATAVAADPHLRATGAEDDGAVRDELALGRQGKAAVRRVLREAGLPVRGPALGRYLNGLTPAERAALGARLYAALWPLVREAVEGEPETAAVASRAPRR